MKKLHIITFLILSCNFGYSQRNKVEKLIFYKEIKQTFNNGVGNWTYLYELENGLIVKQKNYCGKDLRLIQNNIYDKNKNVIYEISSYDSNKGNKIDTVSKYIYKYDKLDRLIEKNYGFGIIETYSDFDENSNPKLIERYNENGQTLYGWPITEKFEYDSSNNVIKEIKITIEYPELKTDTIKKFKIETNLYKYDEYDNVIEIRRHYDPEEEFPILMTGGRPLYALENFKYKYNSKGLWTKEYLLLDGKKILISKRKFKE